MSGKVINLRTARKRRARDDKDKAAAENRTRFGRTKAEKSRDVSEVSETERHLDRHQLGREELDPDK
jgi:hypothetical protein